MTTAELVTALRNLLDDNEIPNLWTSAELLTYLNDAEEQACRRAYLLKDKDTASVCHLSIVASVGVYELHSKVIRVDRLAVSGLKYDQKTRDWLDGTFEGWEETYGTIPGYFCHEADNELVITPMLYSAVVASLIVNRLPLRPMNLDSGSIVNVPSIAEMYHADLLLWGAHRAYMKNDSDTLNVQLAQTYEAKFTARFGPIPSIRDERIRKQIPGKTRARVKSFG
jgi:hypothetical protein